MMFWKYIDEPQGTTNLNFHSNTKFKTDIVRNFAANTVSSFCYKKSGEYMSTRVQDGRLCRVD